MILLYVVDIFGKYSWVVLLKDKKGVLLLLMYFKVFQLIQKKKNK